MRYLVSFVVSVALVSLPVVVQGQRHSNEAESQVESAPVDAAEERDPASQEPYVVDPKLSPMGIQRWHPEAFDPTVKSEREHEFELRYAPPTTEEAARQEELRNRNRAIAIGVMVPVLAIGLAAALGLAITAPLRNWDSNN